MDDKMGQPRTHGRERKIQSSTFVNHSVRRRTYQNNSSQYPHGATELESYITKFNTSQGTIIPVPPPDRLHSCTRKLFSHVVH
ncbi:hypothetical protein Ac2012v2_007603 [Leucoagaricus gongylophorus]